MSILDEITEYAKECISDKIISCQKHKWACIRLLDDLERSQKSDESFPYVWNEEEAKKIVNWFTYLRHSKGILAGKPIYLMNWQKFRICQLYGWRHKKTGYKRFKRSYVQVGRKNAKSQEEAGIALYELATQSTKNGEVYEIYTAGVKRDQSKIITNECALMLKGSILASKFKIQYNRGEADLIQHIKTGSKIKALCKEDGRKGDGTNPAVLVLDEYHQHPTTEFYDLFKGANTKESLLMIITTAGVDLTFPCYTQEYYDCSRLLNPFVEEVKDDGFFADICELDENDDISDERQWIKANPIRMTYEEGRQKVQEEYSIAKRIPEKMVSFKTKCLNIWVQAKAGCYMDMEKWAKCLVDKITYDVKGLDVYVGFDMSSKIDLTSVAFVVPVKVDETVKYLLWSHSFAPNWDILAEREEKDSVTYKSWVEQGYITVTNSQIIDQNAVMDYVQNFCREKELNINTLCFDPNNAGKIMAEYSDLGYTVEEVFQSQKHLNESTKGFREQVYSGNVVWEKNPVLNFAMSNAIIKSTNDYIKIDKSANKKKIDPVDATLCAFKLAMYHKFGNGNQDYGAYLDEFMKDFF